MDKKAIIETVKSALRALYFAVLGAVGTFLVSLASSQDLINSVRSINILGTEVVLQVGVAIVFVLGFLAKALDRYVRHSSKNHLNGIAPNFLQR